jgi:hypothetical protein
MCSKGQPSLAINADAVPSHWQHSASINLIRSILGEHLVSFLDQCSTWHDVFVCAAGVLLWHSIPELCGLLLCLALCTWP